MINLSILLLLSSGMVWLATLYTAVYAGIIRTFWRYLVLPVTAVLVSFMDLVFQQLFFEKDFMASDLAWMTFIGGFFEEVIRVSFVFYVLKVKSYKDYISVVSLAILYAGVENTISLSTYWEDITQKSNCYIIAYSVSNITKSFFHISLIVSSLLFLHNKKYLWFLLIAIMHGTYNWTSVYFHFEIQSDYWRSFAFVRHLVLSGLVLLLVRAILNVNAAQLFTKKFETT